MTDEELVKMARLAQRDDRMATGALYGDLADRIEELTKLLATTNGTLNICRAANADMAESVEGFFQERDELTEQLEAARADAKEAEAYAEELEAKLAKVVEGLRDAVDAWDNHNKTGDMMQGYWVTDARATLAEIEGEKE